jgi:hypothetical protein
MTINMRNIVFVFAVIMLLSSCAEEKKPVYRESPAVAIQPPSSMQQQTSQNKEQTKIVKDDFSPVTGKELMKCMPTVVGGAKILTPSTGRSETAYGYETRADIEVIYGTGVTVRIGITDYAGHYYAIRERYEVPRSEIGVEMTSLTLGAGKGFQMVNIYEKSASIRFAVSQRFGIDIEVLKYTQDFGSPSKVLELLDLQLLEKIAQTNVKK